VPATGVLVTMRFPRLARVDGGEGYGGGIARCLISNGAAARTHGAGTT